MNILKRAFEASSMAGWGLIVSGVQLVAAGQTESGIGTILFGLGAILRPEGINAKK